MAQMLAYCGIDCAQCPAYVATQANDVEAQQRLLEQWRVQFQMPEMPIEAVFCDGCTSAGRHGGYCTACPIRACGMERGVANCGHCADYSCDKVDAFVEHAEQLRLVLDEIHRSLMA